MTEDNYAPELLEVPGVGRISAGKLIGEIAGIERFKSEAQLAHFAGCAPIPASSGNTRRWRFARYGNRQLNTAFYRIARTQARVHPGARAYLARKRPKASRAPKRCAASSACWSGSSGRHSEPPVSRGLLFLNLDLERALFDIPAHIGETHAALIAGDPVSLAREHDPPRSTWLALRSANRPSQRLG